jgi:hypothetical protein
MVSTSPSQHAQSDMYQTLTAELEATRQTFQALVATLTPADWTRPSANPAWSIGELLWHITGYLFLILQQLIWLQSGTFPDLTQRSAEDLNRGNVEQARGSKAPNLHIDCSSLRGRSCGNSGGFTERP